MKTKTLFALISMFFINSSFLFGQLQSFDLSTYKNPFYKRQQLDFSLNLNGVSNFTVPNNVSNPFKTTNSAFGGTFTGNYLNVLNSPEMQQTWQIGLTEKPYWSKSKYNQGNGTYDVWQYNTNYLNSSIITSNRIYKSNLNFFEIDVNAYFTNNNTNAPDKYYNLTTDTLTSTDENKNNNISLYGSVGLRYGKGRIENVQDARLAVYILDDLGKHNRLAHTPTNEEILAFSKLITEITNKRFFDARLRKIAEITAVDSFLRASNLVTNTDAAYFTTVTDNWENAAGSIRTAGFRYSVGISPTGNWDQSTQKYSSLGTLIDNDTQTEHSLGALANLLVDYDKPLNLYWQFNAELNVGYLWLREVSEDEFNSPTYLGNCTQYSGNLIAMLGFYPNSRTYASCTLGLTCYEEFSKLLNQPVSVADKGNAIDLWPYFVLSGYYYITQKTRLQGAYSLSYNNSKMYDNYFSILNSSLSGNKYLQQSFSITLTYSLF